MLRIDDKTVQLTNIEIQASEYFEGLLDKGYDIPTAINKMCDRFQHAGLSPEFILYKSY